MASAVLLAVGFSIVIGLLFAALMWGISKVAESDPSNPAAWRGAVEDLKRKEKIFKRGKKSVR